VIRLQNTGSIRVTGSTRVTGHWRPGRVGSRVNVTDPVPSLRDLYDMRQNICALRSL